ncbi:hypothetical protein FGKAn22_21930 [Ferrigenium kumadai]|uniref:PepSY domain-containing protein n=1 Tax=Ferrigenium kumadai TaxID=1682490 RepID=A0AAN1T1R5_9PROT|nr:PepSY-associated TM helix domain-containing protein [Ferrigenium kumadai]BBJ00501.1 hypothetical protein FGKAn22_21930 [Ferrigenium kumadai]
MKRLLFEIHRWGGIALALFMVLWFFSGLLIVFAEPPTPTRAQQLAHAETLTPETGWLSAGAAWDASTEQRKEFLRLRTPAKPAANGNASASGEKKSTPAVNGIVDAHLVRQGGEPLWLVEDGRGQHLALSALDGSLHATDAGQALKIAQVWAERDGARPVSYVETLDKPAILRNQDNLRPFHRIAIEDGAGSELLISAVTGEVVHASTRIQRGLYWAGNWVHLFRPLELAGASNDTRVEVLKWTAFVAVVASLTGLVVGWLRWRPGWFGKKTYSEGRVHPYRNVWFKLHFWGGLTGGVLALAWGLSGFLNNNPWQLFSPANPGKEELKRYAGGEDPSVAQSWRPTALVGAEADVVELAWRRLGDETVPLAYTRDGRRLPQASDGAGSRFGDASLLAAVHRLAGDVPVASQTLLQEYDNYYYLRHHRDVADRPLPVLRVELADAAGTHLYIDPQDGRLLAKQDRSRRVFRWLYSALHHWDFGWLYQRPLWDAWMVVWVLLGLVLSVSAVAIGWKRLLLTFRRRQQDVPDPAALSVADSTKLATESRAG